MSNLVAHSAIGSSPQYWPQQNLRLEERAGLGLLRLQVYRADPEIKQAIAQSLEMALPEAGYFSQQDDKRIHWLTPTEWLLVLPSTQVDTLSAQLECQPVYLTDMSDSRVTLQLTGEQSSQLLAQGCALDLQDRAFPQGSSTVTKLTKIPAMVSRTGEQYFEVTVDRSFADYIWNWLVDGVEGLV